MQITADLVIGSLLEHGRCADCGGPYAAEDVQVLSHRGPATWELAVECRRCRTLVLIQAVARRNAPSLAHRARPVPQAPTTHERRRLGRRAPAGRDEAREVAEFLDAFDGDFARHFGRSAGES